MKPALLVAMALLVSPGCGERGSGVPVEQQRMVGEFSRVRVDGVIQLTASIEPGTPTVRVRADENLIGKVVARVDDDTLVLEVDGAITTQIGVTATVTLPRLDALALSGASKATVKGLQAERIEVALEGASQATLIGVATELVIETDGAANLDAARLQARRVTVQAGGASRVDVEASETLTAAASGASSVRYGGQPTVTATDSGSASVKPR